MKKYSSADTGDWHNYHIYKMFYDWRKLGIRNIEQAFSSWMQNIIHDAWEAGYLAGHKDRNERQ